jgi:hypothetical protein
MTALEGAVARAAVEEVSAPTAVQEVVAFKPLEGVLAAQTIELIPGTVPFRSSGPLVPVPVAAHTAPATATLRNATMAANRVTLLQRFAK